MPTTSFLSALFVAGYAVALASATTFMVGDDQGWTMGVDYIVWVKGKTFAVGDKLGEYVAALLIIRARLSTDIDRASVPLQLRAHAFGNSIIAVFNYPSEEHTVTEVRKDDYFACAGGNALSKSNDRSGSTNVTLTAPGTRYFICSIPGHCTIGMKIAVTVAGGGPPSMAPPGATSAGAAAWGAPSPAIVSMVAAAVAKLALS
ncbi:hypothetical protein PR202_gb22352 [Eleusine coracana subsp. coracana]|uniref:Phytocyanin domain-containing protein n=1 Tax=Eleusine coracana subsp. coracana TaxID=191504 RepID=A0AAV5FDF4_ELECO|nr:hypothetical protein PR202_gb22352 [Eleusine coracana subsp. coracana]